MGSPGEVEQRIMAGGTFVRRWRVSRARTSLSVEVWTPWPAKALITIACGLGLLTSVLALAMAANAGPTISAWVAATIYVLAILFVIAGTCVAAGRERLTVRPKNLLLERFVLVMWRHALLERVPQIGIGSRRGRSLTSLRMISIETPMRELGFGAWLTPVSAETIAAQVRAAARPQGGDPVVAFDGVARRVATLDDDGTLPGAAHLMVLEGRKASRGNVDRLFGRTLPGGAVTPAVVVAMFLLFVGPAISFPTAFSVLIVGALVCLALAEGGVVELIRRRSLRRHETEPWRAPRCWRSDVLRVSALRRALGPGLLAAATLGFAVWIWIGRGGGAPGVRSVVLGIVATGALWRLQNIVFMGTTEVRLRRIPYRVGEEIVLDFAVAERGGHFEDISFVLSRLVEVKRGLRAPVVAVSHIARYRLPDDQPPPGPGDQVTVRFVVPPTASGTRLDPDRPATWELLVTGTTSCGAYEETFPIPLFDA